MPWYFQHAYQRLASNTMCLVQKYYNYAYFGLLGNEYLRLLAESHRQQIRSFSLFTLNPEIAAYDQVEIQKLIPQAEVSVHHYQEDSLPEEGFEAKFDIALLNNTLALNREPEEGLFRAIKCVRPDGFVSVVTPGLHTLAELRNALFMAKSERSGGFSSLIPKFFDACDLSGLIHRLGLRMGGVHTQVLTPTFDTVVELLKELSSWGMAGVMASSGSFTRDELLALAALYQTFFYAKDQPGKVTATVEMLIFGGFVEAPGQLSRGGPSAELKDIRTFIEEDDKANNEKTAVEAGKIYEEEEDDVDKK